MYNDDPKIYFVEDYCALLETHEVGFSNGCGNGGAALYCYQRSTAILNEITNWVNGMNLSCDFTAHGSIWTVWALYWREHYRKEKFNLFNIGPFKGD